MKYYSFDEKEMFKVPLKSGDLVNGLRMKIVEVVLVSRQLLTYILSP